MAIYGKQRVDRGEVFFDAWQMVTEDDYSKRTGNGQRGRGGYSGYSNWVKNSPIRYRQPSKLVYISFF
jgi:hypothetical protein